MEGGWGKIGPRRLARWPRSTIGPVRSGRRPAASRPSGEKAKAPAVGNRGADRPAGWHDPDPERAVGARGHDPAGSGPRRNPGWPSRELRRVHRAAVDRATGPDHAVLAERHDGSAVGRETTSRIGPHRTGPRPAARWRRPRAGQSAGLWVARRRPSGENPRDVDCLAVDEWRSDRAGRSPASQTAPCRSTPPVATQPAVGRDRDGENLIAVVHPGGQRSAGLRVPELGGPVAGAGQDRAGRRK